MNVKEENEDKTKILVMTDDQEYAVVVENDSLTKLEEEDYEEMKQEMIAVYYEKKICLQGSGKETHIYFKPKPIDPTPLLRWKQLISVSHEKLGGATIYSHLDR